MKVEDKLVRQVCQVIDTISQLAVTGRHDEKLIEEMLLTASKLVELACKIAGIKVTCEGGVCRIEQQ